MKVKKTELIPETKELLAIAEMYENTTGNQRTTLADKIARNADFFDNIAKGGGYNIKTLKKFRDWFQANLPDRSASQQPPPS